MLLHLISAVAPDVTPVGPDATSNSLLNLDPFVVELVLGAVIPFLVAWASTSKTAAWVQKLATIVFSGIAGLITVGATDGGGSIISVASLKAAVLTAVLAMTAYWVTIRNSATEDKLHALGPIKDKAA